MTKKRLNMREFAKLVGFSKTTVSMVFNDAPGIPKKTKDKVLKAARKFDYQPSMVARSLRSKRTKAIGLMLPSITNPFFSEIVKGEEDLAIEEGYSAILCNYDEDIKKESLYFRMFEDRWIDGIIFSGIIGDKHEANYIEEIEKKGIPIVFIDRGLEGHLDDVVMVDNHEATRRGTKYLIELGHRRIGFMSGPTEIRIFAERLKGYKEALQESEIEFDPSLVIEGEQSAKATEFATEKFLIQKALPTAILTTSDVVAITVVRALQKSGLVVPDDISVMGFDDIPFASLVIPSLTTIAQPMQEMGREAFKLLVDKMERKEVPKRKIVLSTKLVIRESTAKAKTAMAATNNCASSSEQGRRYGGKGRTKKRNKDVPS